VTSSKEPSVKIDRDEVLLDVGYKTEGVIPSRELSIKHDVDPSEVVNVGDLIEALVLQKEDKEGRLILSKKRASTSVPGAMSRRSKTKTVSSPARSSRSSRADSSSTSDSAASCRRHSSSCVACAISRHTRPGDRGQILELDKNRKHVVLSRRALLEQTQSESRSTFLNNLRRARSARASSRRSSTSVRSSTGGVDGLVHVSELSWKHIEHASEVVEVGQEVTVEILEVDWSASRVSLSLKATQETRAAVRQHSRDWSDRTRRSHQAGAGSVVRPGRRGIEGLVHISELSAATSSSRAGRAVRDEVSSRSSTSTSSVVASR